MSVATVQNSIASQKEFIRPELPLLYMTGSRLWNRIKTRTDAKAVSNRPIRAPLAVSPGGKFRQFEPDGGDMQLGSGPLQTFGTLSCVYFLQATQYTARAEWTTDSDEKAIKDYVAFTEEEAVKSFVGYMDAIVSNGDGSNLLDTVVSTSGTNGLVVNNANLFQDNQDIDVYTPNLAAYVGTVTVAFQDIGNNTIWLTGPFPGGTTTGYLLLVSGSAGVANSGIFGLKYYHAGTNTGSFMNIQRSAFPGRFNTPTIAVNGPLTPAIARAIEAQVELAMGIDKADESEVVIHCNVDMRAAWEANAFLVQRVIQNEVKGDTSVDMLKRRAPTEMGGRPMLINERALPGRLDILSLKNWFRIESHPFDQYEVGGQTIFPAYGISGGLAASMISYYVTGCQIGMDQPRLDASLTSVTVPKNYFGK